MTELPNWVYDLLIDLQHQRDVHPAWMFQSGGMAEPAQWDWCQCSALQLVPLDVQVKAEAIAAYRRKEPT